MSGVRTMYENTQGLTFVVDSNDRDRVVEARDGLHRMSNENTRATSGEGLYEGLDWLSNNIANKA
ncbi:putative small GTPase superfamily, ARF/SAR type, P-loop containing nucleoside triphosphate hydrolase [Rosa chinensis]|uniref:Putative small GTPase superfamily, ARF/SAR type, P-loop containing nucleoside triphosphate hydrolase n=1 Tax=Rosa chinensis TaxID=74649 RepID=A0A2P6QW56_ROSCH|nr:putative small GTPase superfamily, ARF/SAR type, P-loop containing nucleoside triphosphate hydrolase [Rosa chinensis]